MPVSFTLPFWIAFAIYWLLASRSGKCSVPIGQSPCVRAIALIFIVLIPGLNYLPLGAVPCLGWRLLPAHLALTAIGFGLMAFGSLFVVRAGRTLHGNWSGAVALKEDPAPNRTLLSAIRFISECSPAFLVLPLLSVRYARCCLCSASLRCGKNCGRKIPPPRRFFAAVRTICAASEATYFGNAVTRDG